MKINIEKRKNIINPNFEVVERKGVGHPDTVSDSLAEKISVEYSKYCLEHFGYVLHHNVDKVGVLGGLIDLNWQNSYLKKPIRVILDGRISCSFGGEKIPVYEIAEKAIKEQIVKNLPILNVEKDLEIVDFSTDYSKNPHWFNPRAMELSAVTGKLPETCQVVINESREVFLSPNGTLIGIHNLGYRLTSAGVDKFTKNSVTLIPDDPDGTSRKIREELEKLTGKNLSVLIADSDGCDDRRGSIGVALGISGFHPILKTKQIDVVTGKEKFSEEDISSMLANAASILLGQRGKGTPVVIISGLSFQRDLEAGIIKDVLP